MKYPRLPVILFGVFCLTVPSANAEVVDPSPTGFTVKLHYSIQAPAGEVYRTMVRNIGDWWSSSHTYSGDSHNLVLEDNARGCFCETLPNQGSVRHMEVVLAMPGKLLRMTGGLGPLQEFATGMLTITLTPSKDTPAGNTELQVAYPVSSFQSKEMEKWGPLVEEVLNEQFARLKTFAEKGGHGVKEVGETK